MDPNARRARAALAAVVGLLAGLALTAGIDVHVRHGWAATWWVTPADTPRVTHVGRGGPMPHIVYPSGMPRPEEAPGGPRVRPMLFGSRPQSPPPILRPEANEPDSGVVALPPIPAPLEPAPPAAPLHVAPGRPAPQTGVVLRPPTPGSPRPSAGPNAAPGTAQQAPLAEPRRVLARTLERRVVFPNDMRPVSRYLQHWDFDRLGVPDRIPPLDVTLDAWLRVEHPVQLRVDASPAAALLVDGHVIGGAPVLPGVHRVRVTWRGALDRAVFLELMWDEGGSPHPVPARALTPVGGAWPAARIVLVAAGFLGSLLFAATLAWIASATPLARRRAVVLTGAVLAIAYGTFLRSYDYDVAPDFRENADELFAEWDGWSLLTDGTPRGWSLWSEAYDPAIHRELLPYFQREPFVVISPYFEHPPLLHLLVGAVAKLSGARDWPHARLMWTRLVPISLQAIALFLLLAIARRVHPRGASAFLSVLLYAVLPFAAIQGRVIKEEALLVPLTLAGTLFFLKWRDDGRHTRHIVLAALATSACLLAKLTGAFMPVALLVLVARERRWKPSAIVVATTVGAVAVLVGYAATINLGEWWWSTIHQASGRPTHFNLFLRWFDDALMNHQLIGRGWLLFLWLGAALAAPRLPRGHVSALVVPLFVYMLAISVSSGNWTFGWYAMPFYPFLCILAARTIEDLWTEPDVLRGTLFGTLFVMYSLNFLVDPTWAMSPEGSPLLRPIVSAVVLTLVGPFLLHAAFPGRRTRWLCRAAVVLGLAAFVVGASVLVLRYDVNYYAYQNFDRNGYFDR